MNYARLRSDCRVFGFMAWVLVSQVVGDLSGQVTHTIVDNAAVVGSSGFTNLAQKLDDIFAQVSQANVQGGAMITQAAATAAAASAQATAAASQQAAALAAMNSALAVSASLTAQANGVAAANTAALTNMTAVVGGAVVGAATANGQLAGDFRSVYGTGITNGYGVQIDPTEVQNSVPNLLQSIATNVFSMADFFRGTNTVTFNITNSFGTNADGSIGFSDTNSAAILQALRDSFGEATNANFRGTVAMGVLTNRAIDMTNLLTRIQGSVFDSAGLLRSVTNTLELGFDGTWARLDDLNSNLVARSVLLNSNLTLQANSLTNLLTQGQLAMSNSFGTLETNLAASFYTNSEALLLGLRGVSNAIQNLANQGEPTNAVGTATPGLPSGFGSNDFGGTASGWAAGMTGAVSGAALINSRYSTKVGQWVANLNTWESRGLYRRDDWVWTFNLGFGITNLQASAYGPDYPKFDKVVAAFRFLLTWLLAVKLAMMYYTRFSWIFWMVLSIKQLKTFSATVLGTQVAAWISLPVYVAIQIGIVTGLGSGLLVAVDSLLLPATGNVLDLLITQFGDQEQLMRMVLGVVGYLFPITAIVASVATFVYAALAAELMGILAKATQTAMVSSS